MFLMHEWKFMLEESRKMECTCGEVMPDELIGFVQMCASDMGRGDS
jgi:hypothetical protein